MPAHVGEAAMPEQDTAGYAVQPALGDACIHLAAVPAFNADVTLLRCVWLPICSQNKSPWTV